MMRPSPKTPEDYRARAATCERLAASATSSESREIMHFLATRWRDLADEAEGKSPVRQAQPMPSSDGQGAYEDRE
jgi:hypothetical protein